MSTFFINLRFFMYSASLGPHFRRLAARKKWLNAYLLTDQAYAMSIVDFQQQQRVHKHWFYLGTAVSLWVVWQAGTIVGVVVGAQVPASWSLDFAVPLTFLALVVPTITDRPMAMAALVGGITAVLAANAPFNTGLIIAAIAGILAGILVQRS